METYKVGLGQEGKGTLSSLGLPCVGLGSAGSRWQERLPGWKGQDGLYWGPGMQGTTGVWVGDFSSETAKERHWVIAFSSLYYDTLYGSATPPHMEMFCQLSTLVGWAFVYSMGADRAPYRKWLLNELMMLVWNMGLKVPRGSCLDK